MSECKYPDKCPITGEPLFMEIENPDLGLVPTYGGPYDSYTIPEVDEEGDFIRYRYDHDEGFWVDGVDNVGNATELVMDLRAKLEEEKDESKMLENLCNRMGKERDDLQRKVESLTKVKHEFYEGMVMYKKACDDLVVLKEKQYIKIDELEAQNADLRGALEDSKIILQHAYDIGEDTSDHENYKYKLDQALTASGDNRYSRVMEAAKAIKSEMENRDNCNIPGPESRLGKAINSLFAVVLGESEKDAD